jgi:hypothetical protein
MLKPLLVLTIPLLSLTWNYRVIELGNLGAIGTGQPCTPAQMDACELACREEMQPGEQLQRIRCEQTLTPQYANPFPRLGIDCHCYVVTVAPEPGPVAL